MMNYIGICTLLLHTLVSFVLTAHCSGADGLERGLLKQAPSILADLSEKNYQNVGVLKFHVKNGDSPVTDRAGALNLRIADKLELALLLKTDIRNPIGVVRRASAVAATIPGANHLSADGRQKLFSKEYSLAWGNTKVTPDAFLTGVATISSHMATMNIGILVFDAKSEELRKVASFDVKTDLDDLLEVGESFTVRGVFDQGKIINITQDARKDEATTEAIQTSLTIKKETVASNQPQNSIQHTLSVENRDAPISLEVRYDGRPIPLEFRDGSAFLRGPTEHQKVTLIVRRRKDQTSRLGVVVKVNGENSLYRQKLEDAQCVPWVMAPELKEFEIKGFQTNLAVAQEFKVLSAAESQAREMDYGEHVGTISITVFRELTVEPKPALDSLSEVGEDIAVLSRGLPSNANSATLGALRAQLFRSATRGGDSLIVEGRTIGNDVKTVQFKTDPVPVMSGVIRYYHPQDLPPK